MSNQSRKSIAPSLSTTYRFLFFNFIILFFAVGIFAQDLPDKIRGYKVYKAKVSVQSGEAKSGKDSEAIIKMGEPVLVDTGFSGVAFEISGEVYVPDQSGTVDFLTFKDFRVNDLSVEIEEYKTSFEIKKNEPTKLPSPIKVSLGLTQAMRGILSEQRDSREFWQVTGRVFVFGHFKKAGFKFKRVVPVDISLRIKNPLRTNL